ncbi:MAG: lamin tail domain-containing protein [Kiritimatiellae bacterium]|nr:lamin tail domain-containing protein [Kiritimatiellia bacterium]
MRNSNRCIALMLLLLAGLAGPLSAELVLSEILASNSAGMKDGFGNREDWIEIHNSGPTAVNLHGYYLSDQPDLLTKWSLPAITIPAGGYQLVFASGKDLIDPLGYPHANFSLKRAGDYLALTHPDGLTIADQFAPAFPEQFTDISYGMDSSSGERRYFDTPTPTAANAVGYEGVVQGLSFSATRGFYDAPIQVALTSSTEGALIRYTTDGTKPSAAVGTLYSAPLGITNTTPLRAVACKSGWLSTEAASHTYLFVDQTARQPVDPPGWPRYWGPDSNVPVVPANYGMDQRVVDNAVTNYSVREALLDIPTLSMAMLPADFIDPQTGIYANPLSRWERECSIEYIHPGGAKGFQHNCKVEVHGNSSRNPARMQKHSLRLTFTREYGPAKLEYPLFEGSPVQSFNQLVLRACFTDSWALVSWANTRYRPNDSMYIRDVWMKNSLRDMGQPSSRGNFVHLYVNGLYFGLHNLTERLAPEFFADHLGGAPEDWEVNKDFSSPGSRWNALRAIKPSTLAGYQQIQSYLDLDNFADYILLHLYADAEDWPHHNGDAAANPISGDGKFRFFVWDQEIALDYHGRAASRIDNTGGVGALFQQLRTSSEFRLHFADRFYKHCFHAGALSLGAAQARYRATADLIDKAIVAESARWGDTQMRTPYASPIEQPSPLDNFNHIHYPPAPHWPDYYFTREDSWLVERDNVISNYLPAIHDPANSYALVNLLRSKGLYPEINPPEFSQNGGEISAGTGVTMAADAGAIYYTLDGSDPRLLGGAIHGQALLYDKLPVFLIHNPATIKARALDGGVWSALHAAQFFVDTEVARPGNLAISEIHYNPAGSDDYEFLELQNIGTTKLTLEGVRIAAAVEFTFGNILLEPAQHVVVVKDLAAFNARYLDPESLCHYAPILVAGAWSGQLSNGGELIQLFERGGNIIQEFSYDDDDPWPTIADGRGASLQRANPAVPPGAPEHWSAISPYHGSPGRAFEPPSIVINEVMSNPSAGGDWIELLNIAANAVDISGWYLSDNLDQPFKFQIPVRAPLAPGEFALYDQTQFGQGATAFGFNKLGEEAVLIEAAGSNILRIVAYQQFGAAAPATPFGRHLRQDGTALFTALSAATPAAANAPPLIGAVVISEIMYHPPAGKLEYIEIANTTAAAVLLHDPGVPASTWTFSSAVTYAFPAGAVIPACGRVLITETDPVSFRAAYDVPPAIEIFGPWSGQLSNSGESIRLSRPGAPEPDNSVPMILVERVDYADYAPWPAAADGAGASLERLDYKAPGNDWRNWYASATSRGTPGFGPDPCSSVANQYPRLADPGPLAVDEGTLLAVQLQAADPDPGQRLCFTLQGALPAGIAITPAGLLTWIPSEEHGPGIFEVKAVVTDNGIPNLSDSLILPIAVREVNTPPRLLRGSHHIVTNSVPLIPFRNLWRYCDNGSDQGTRWREPAFVDFSWNSGLAPLGYGGSQQTTVSYGSNPQAKYPTTYFRHTFTAGLSNLGDDLWIDFGQPGMPVQAGWQAYTALHERVASFLPQTFPAFNTAITINASWAAGAVDAAAQMYDRGNRPSDTPDLLRDWVGTDRREIGNPFTLTITGLPPGTYSWLSYHHDTLDQSGLFDVTVNDALGAATTRNIAISSGNLPFAAITTFASAIVSDGSDIFLVFDKHPHTIVAYTHFLMNAFKLTRLSHDLSGTLAALKLRLIRDDGAVVYLNGVEIVRDNMPTNDIGYLDYASSGIVGADESTPQIYTLPPDNLITGLNTIAVEVHQHSAKSSDLSFDLALEAEYRRGGPQGLTDYTVSAGELVRFLCQSVDHDRPVQAITYQLGENAPAGAALDPRTGLFTWTPLAADGPAVVTLTIIATDNGTPPLSDSQSFDITVLARLKSGDVRFENGRVIWAAVPGDQYRIEYCSDLRLAEWRLLETRTATTTAEAFIDPDFPGVKTRFYRILSLRYRE